MKIWMINATTRRCAALILHDGIGKCPAPALWLIHHYAVIYWLRSLHSIICNPVEPNTARRNIISPRISSILLYRLQVDPILIWIMCVDSWQTIAPKPNHYHCNPFHAISGWHSIGSKTEYPCWVVEDVWGINISINVQLISNRSAHTSHFMMDNLYLVVCSQRQLEDNSSSGWYMMGKYKYMLSVVPCVCVYTRMIEWKMKYDDVYLC